MDHGTSAPLARTAALAESISIMSRLRAPNGCPWDREQTFDSIKSHTLEETYEVFDAIERRAWPDLKDELGDLLLQVLFYSQMADEAGYFTIEDVATNLNAKLIRRHPHIFAGEEAVSSEDVKANWEAIKLTERSQKPAAAERFMDAVPSYTPALVEAMKLGQRAAKVGFDWQDTNQLLVKLDEEMSELREEVGHGTPDRSAIEDEFGDLLFTVVNLARRLNLEPEFALRRANRKFRERFNAMEAIAGGVEAVRTATPDALDASWRAAKQTVSAAEVARPAAAELPADKSCWVPG